MNGLEDDVGKFHKLQMYNVSIFIYSSILGFFFLWNTPTSYSDWKINSTSSFQLQHNLQNNASHPITATTRTANKSRRPPIGVREVCLTHFRDSPHASSLCIPENKVLYIILLKITSSSFHKFANVAINLKINKTL